MVIIKTPKITNVGQNVEAKETLHCWWECKLVQLLWKIVWKFHTKIKLELPYDPETASLVAQLVKDSPAMMGRPWFDPWVGKIPWRSDRLPTPIFLGFSGGSDDKESACNVGDLSLIPRLVRSPERGHDNPLQYSCLENPHGQEKPGRLQAMGSQRVGLDWATKHSTTSDYLMKIL